MYIKSALIRFDIDQVKLDENDSKSICSMSKALNKFKTQSIDTDKLTSVINDEELPLSLKSALKELLSKNYQGNDEALIKEIKNTIIDNMYPCIRLIAIQHNKDAVIEHDMQDNPCNEGIIEKFSNMRNVLQIKKAEPLEAKMTKKKITI